MSTITLETSRKIGAEIRLSGTHLTAHLAAINGLYTASEKDSTETLKKARDLIESHLQAILAGASSIKSGAVDPANPTDEEAVEARKKVWLSIKQCTSKKNYFFVDGQRPGPKKGATWLISWAVPPVAAKPVDDKKDHTPDAPNATETVAPVEIPAPTPTELSSADRLLQIESLLDSLGKDELLSLSVNIEDRLKAMIRREELAATDKVKKAAIRNAKIKVA